MCVSRIRQVLFFPHIFISNLIKSGERKKNPFCCVMWTKECILLRFAVIFTVPERHSYLLFSLALSMHFECVKNLCAKNRNCIPDHVDGCLTRQ